MTNICRFLTLAITLAFCLTISGLAQESDVDSPKVLSTLENYHPRLMLTGKDLEHLKILYTQDRVLQKCMRDVLKDADNCAEKPMLTYRKIGPRLLHISRECLHRIYALGLAYRWTGEEKYAYGLRKADTELLDLLNEGLKKIMSSPKWGELKSRCIFSGSRWGR
ncbi:MAG: hypothetical protein RQ760_01005 [Sedimentisphaerales bacterium]|nr:hypothetical protein [Sedimentisphaerales bacterium]